MITQCCVCKKYRKDQRWTAVADAQDVNAGVSHGYCPKCAEQAFREIRTSLSSSTSKPAAKAAVL